MRRCAIVATIGALASCHSPEETAANDYLALAGLIGSWSWTLNGTVAATANDDGTKTGAATTVEDERWEFRPGALPTELVGRYVRAVEVRAADRIPFTCNQRLSYRQRAVFDLAASSNADGTFAIKETGYRVEPSACDHGFRHAGTYTGRLVGGQLALHWDGGTQTLLHTSSDTPAVAADPWPATVEPTGAWEWTATSRDEAGNVHDETEQWQITRRTDTALDATYRRRVTVRSADGSNIACANAPSWTFDDSYVLDAVREEEHWHFHERAVDAGDHPCLRASPQRALDEATVAQQGDNLVLEWRGKRRQVLYRGL
ncbi:MAG TPA: hypothetical protein VGM90_02875 [Kofleriaceae bacterium]|jgi:hypothetical protein